VVGSFQPVTTPRFPLWLSALLMAGMTVWLTVLLHSWWVSVGYVVVSALSLYFGLRHRRRALAPRPK